MTEKKYTTFITYGSRDDLYKAVAKDWNAPFEIVESSFEEGQREAIQNNEGLPNEISYRRVLNFYRIMQAKGYKNAATEEAEAN